MSLRNQLLGLQPKATVNRIQASEFFSSWKKLENDKDRKREDSERIQF